MGHVKGIGGLFFRARDPDTLTAWYRERLGVGAGCSADDGIAPDEWVWNVTAGPLVFSPFKADSDYFAADMQYMLNLRVDDLDAVLAPFHEAGDEVVTEEEWNDPAVGRFARVHDPEGNPIELWEPPKEKAGRSRSSGTSRAGRATITPWRRSRTRASMSRNCRPA